MSEAKSKLKSAPRIAKWLLSAARDYRLQIALNLTVGVLHVACSLSIVWATKRCIDQGLSYAPLLIFVMLADVGLAYLIRWIRTLLGVRSRNRLQARYYHQILSADWLTMHREHSGDTTNRLTHDVETISDFLSEKLPQLITTLLQLAGAFIFLCYMDWRLALVIIVLTPAFIFTAQFYMHRMRRFKHEMREQEAGIQGFIQETVLLSLLIKSLERVSYVDHKLGDRHQRLYDITRRNTRYSANAALLINISFALGYLIAFFWGVYRMSAGIITFGAMVAFIQLVGQIQGPIRALTSYVSTFIATFTAADRLMALPEAPFPPDGPPSPKRSLCSLRAGENTGGAILIKNLCFAYEDGKPIFSNWSAEIPTSKITAIIGHTGIGKTTLIQLLLGILKPQSGTISYTESPTQSHQQEVTNTKLNFAYVPQGNSLLSGTIRENLLYGNPNASEEEMRHALRLADAEFATDLDATVGERGSGLSEGQAQRIGIARALLCRAEVMLFDEAFSALDTDTATKILHAIRADRPNQAIVMVTHRETLLHMTDQVIRLD